MSVILRAFQTIAHETAVQSILESAESLENARWSGSVQIVCSSYAEERDPAWSNLLNCWISLVQAMLDGDVDHLYDAAEELQSWAYESTDVVDFDRLLQTVDELAKLADTGRVPDRLPPLSELAGVCYGEI